ERATGQPPPDGAVQPAMRQYKEARLAAGLPNALRSLGGLKVAAASAAAAGVARSAASPAQPAGAPADRALSGPARAIHLRQALRTPARIAAVHQTRLALLAAPTPPVPDGRD